MNTEMKKMERPEAPEGFVYNAEGNLIAKQNIPAVELRKDAFVEGVVLRVKEHSKALAAFKEQMFESFESFRVELAEDYGTKLCKRGSGENVKVFSFDGKYRVDFNTRKLKTLGPEVDVVRDLARKYYESKKDILPHDVLIMVQSVMMDSTTVADIINFKNAPYEDPLLRNAQEAAKDALKVIGKKSFMNFYERDEHGEYKQIHLNFAKL
ncbi:DUF3164 family protein [Vibrio scophthalmi]|uniref:DUF3164 family protein n=1 Tax=Vibrio scophthalmi TaxID=45658 RepID=A0A1E3WH74_9VIBR|nr:DUF3164 family protein [Vibrio scophthalmi]ODS05151.1 hypothetical protein VSF3289_04292 [Vibrio scophthalmi]